MKLTIEGQELIRAIRRGLDFDIPPDAEVTIVSGRGANLDRAEIEWNLDGSPFAETEVEDTTNPDQLALPEMAEEPETPPTTKKTTVAEPVADKDLFE